ncbi:Hypothetical protein ADU71_1221 [Pediococcus damnosus]|nr:Hypothetical protein ADU69_1148 [Pediococcus damnosus]AMV65117.1 Hypothetical protein ADU71_1221 [Pediococcus damnosus]
MYRKPTMLHTLSILVAKIAARTRTPFQAKGAGERQLT